MSDNALSLRFRQLCELAAKETDSTKLLALTQDINRLFDEREKADRPPHKGTCCSAVPSDALLARKEQGRGSSTNSLPTCEARKSTP
jgi:hypothetical protein